jgi:predicted homoserine dehydrogenase-like protein
MGSLLTRLRELNDSIRIGIVGIGSIGKGIVLQAQLTPGIECVAIADVVLERAVAWAEYLKRPYERVRTLMEMHEAIRGSKLAVCDDGDLVARCELSDVFVEATNSVAAGGRFGTTAIEHNKHLVMMNYEADLMFGPYLMQLAREKGVVYTVCDGDQPTVLKHLIDEIEFMGFKLVMAGNIKGYLDRYANPTSIVPEADKRNLDYRMCTSYTDGTKLNIEMAVVANGLGLRTAVPGMHGPRVDDIYRVFEHFDFDALWDGKQAIVDYVLGAKPKGGVFAIGYTENQYQQDTLAWFPPEMGPGPFYLFYRPYHLGHFETMATVAQAVLDQHSVLKPDFGFQTNVYAYAKRDLRRGERLDGIGGYTCHGMVENCAENEIHPGVPICVSEDLALTHDVAKDEKLLIEDVHWDPKDYAIGLHLEAVDQGRMELGTDVVHQQVLQQEHTR